MDFAVFCRDLSPSISMRRARPFVVVNPASAHLGFEEPFLESSGYTSLPSRLNLASG